MHTHSLLWQEVVFFNNRCLIISESHSSLVYFYSIFLDKEELLMVLPNLQLWSKEEKLKEEVTVCGSGFLFFPQSVQQAGKDRLKSETNVMAVWQ